MPDGAPVGEERTARRPSASVVVPAHDEADTIAATLRTLLADAAPGEFDVVVVANGCTDATAEQARSVEGVRVVEIATASKIAALREGDRLSSSFPRIYLDGDVTLSTQAARALAEAVRDDGALAAGVPGRYRLDHAPLGLRLFYEFRQSLPVFADGIIGAGVYALSEKGRARFGEWPDVLGDDQFVYRSFTPGERVGLRGHHTLVTPNANLRSVVRRGIRTRRGNDELSSPSSDHGPALPAPSAGFRQALLAALRSPRGIASAITFLGVTVVIRMRARLGGVGDWSVGSSSA